MNRGPHWHATRKGKAPGGGVPHIPARPRVLRLRARPRLAGRRGGHHLPLRARRPSLDLTLGLRHRPRTRRVAPPRRDGGRRVPGPGPMLDRAPAGIDWVRVDGACHVAVALLLGTVIVAAFVILQRQLGTESRLAQRHREAEGRAREMARKADTDVLTGIANRQGFNESMAREFARARRQALPRRAGAKRHDARLPAVGGEQAPGVVPPSHPGPRRGPGEVPPRRLAAGRVTWPATQGSRSMTRTATQCLGAAIRIECMAQELDSGLAARVAA